MLLLMLFLSGRVYWLQGRIPNISYQDAYIYWSKCVVWCSSKNGHQEDMFKNIGLRAQNVITILGSIVNITRGEGSI